jgi:hypothetical protein
MEIYISNISEITYMSELNSPKQLTFTGVP